MESGVFLSHNSLDKPFVRKLAIDLNLAGIRTWVDEAEIAAGASLLRSIESGIEKAKFFVIVLSRNSMDSSWVHKELEMAMTLELERKKIFVIPVVIDDCIVPLFLRGKKYLKSYPDYWSIIDELICVITGAALPVRLTAKEAVKLAKTQYQPLGEVCGISQQGIHQTVSRHNQTDWISGRIVNGRSREWVLEFIHYGEQILVPFTVYDGTVKELEIASFSSSNVHSELAKVTISSLDPDQPQRYMIRGTSYAPPVSINFSFIDSDEVAEKVLGGIQIPYSYVSSSLFYSEALQKYIWRIFLHESTIVDPIAYFDVCAKTGTSIRGPILGYIARNELGVFKTPKGDWKIKLDKIFRDSRK